MNQAFPATRAASDQFYTTYGRVIHSYYSTGGGAFTTDDFGKSVKVPSALARQFINGARVLEDLPPVSLRELDAMWESLRDCPARINRKGYTVLDAPFRHFPRGANVEDVWHWFEAQHPQFSAGEAMQGIPQAK